jgi:glutaredoxin-related protein
LLIYLTSKQQDDVGRTVIQYTGQPTLLQVFVGGQCIAKYYQARRALYRGDLQTMLRDELKKSMKIYK